MEEEGVNSMVEEALILDIDIIEMEHKRELQRELQRLEEKKDAEIREKDTLIQELKNQLNSLKSSEG